jgi:hypothetical protein
MMLHDVPESHDDDLDVFLFSTTDQLVPFFLMMIGASMIDDVFSMQPLPSTSYSTPSH